MGHVIVNMSVNGKFHFAEAEQFWKEILHDEKQEAAVWE